MNNLKLYFVLINIHAKKITIYKNLGYPKGSSYPHLRTPVIKPRRLCQIETAQFSK